jgi:hypothetical protein
MPLLTDNFQVIADHSKNRHRRIIEAKLYSLD